MLITVLSPHRDDAAFSLGLAIGAWLNSGHQVDVVNCFTESQYSPFGEDRLVDADDLTSHVTAQRREEDLHWSKLYRHRLDTYRPVLCDLVLHDMDLADAPKRRQCSVDEVCKIDVESTDPAIAMIRAEVETRVVDALVLPLGIGDHVDHLTARLATQNGWPATLPLGFYEDLPYAARPGAADTIHGRSMIVASDLTSYYADAPGDVSAATERKLELVCCYTSQIDRAVADQIASFCERYGGRERLWVNQAWRDADLGVAR